MSSGGCNITFKVFLEHLNLVRKISVENTGLSYEVLRQRIGGLLSPEELLQTEAAGRFLIQYDDEDGDRITVGGEEELKQMLIDMVRERHLDRISCFRGQKFHFDSLKVLASSFFLKWHI